MQGDGSRLSAIAITCCSFVINLTAFVILLNYALNTSISDRKSIVALIRILISLIDSYLLNDPIIFKYEATGYNRYCYSSIKILFILFHIGKFCTMIFMIFRNKLYPEWTISNVIKVLIFIYSVFTILSMMQFVTIYGESKSYIFNIHGHYKYHYCVFSDDSRSNLYTFIIVTIHFVAYNLMYIMLTYSCFKYSKLSKIKIILGSIIGLILNWIGVTFFILQFDMKYLFDITNVGIALMILCTFDINYNSPSSEHNLSEIPSEHNLSEIVIDQQQREEYIRRIVSAYYETPYRLPRIDNV